MSDSPYDGVDPQLIINELIDLRRIAAVNISATVLIAYDIVLTFSREVESIWKRQWSLITLLYVIIRYGALFDLLTNVIFTLYVANDVTSCKALNDTLDVLDILLLSAIAAFTCLRVWAITARQWIPLVTVFLLSAFIPAANIYNYSVPLDWFIIPDGPMAGCVNNAEPPKALSILPFVTRGVAITTDALVIAITWYKTMYVLKQGRSLHVKTDMTTVLVRNGTLQFAALLLLNILTLLFDGLALATDFTAASQIVYFNNAFSSILISRFLLDLRSVSSSAPDNLTNWNSSSSPEDAVLSSVRFASVVAGDIGAPSDHSTWLSNATTEYDDCGDDERHEQDEREQYQNPTLHEHGGARPTLCQDLELQERPPSVGLAL